VSTVADFQIGGKRRLKIGRKLGVYGNHVALSGQRDKGFERWFNRKRMHGGKSDSGKWRRGKGFSGAFGGTRNGREAKKPCEKNPAGSREIGQGGL
jgi:hypothetical protein